MPKYGVFGYPPFIHATSSLQVHSHLPPNLLYRSDFLQQSETFLHIHKIKIWKQIQFKHGVIADCVMSILKWTHIMTLSGNTTFWKLQCGALFSCHPLATKGPCPLLLDWWDDIKVYQELAKVAKATFGRLARDQSDPRVKLSTPLLTFSHQTVFCISSPALVAPFSSWRVYLFRTLALRALCPPRSLLYHSLSHLISLLLRFSPSLLQAKEILMQHRPMSKEGAITQKNKLNNMNNNNNTEGVFDASLHRPLFANKTCHCLNLNRGD